MKGFKRTKTAKTNDMNNIMEAAVIHEFGDANCFNIEDRPVPVVADGEVLVEVFACGVNPIDLKTRIGQGVSRFWKTTNFPIILGWDISGVVVDSKASKFKVGEEVFGMPRFPALANAYAEFVSAPASDLTRKPQNISHIEAAATPLAALTAWQGLFGAAELKEDHTVLIHAGAGGVGHFAIQLASWTGAHVTATTSRSNTEFVVKLGAQKVIDYTLVNFWEKLQNIDVVLHMIAPELRERSYQTMKPGGHLISITGPVPTEEPKAHSVNGQFISVRPNGEQITQLSNLLASGDIKVNVEASYSLEDISKAHEHVERGHTRGKVVIDLKS